MPYSTNIEKTDLNDIVFHEQDSMARFKTRRTQFLREYIKS